MDNRYSNNQRPTPADNGESGRYDYNPHRSHANSDSPYNRLTGRFNPVTEEDLQAAREARVQRAERRRAGYDDRPVREADGSPRERELNARERRTREAREMRARREAMDRQAAEAAADADDEELSEEEEAAGRFGRRQARSARSDKASQRASDVRAQRRRGSDGRSGAGNGRDGASRERRARRSGIDRVVVNEGARVPRGQAPEWYEANSEREARRWEHNRAARARTSDRPLRQTADDRKLGFDYVRGSRPSYEQRDVSGERRENPAWYDEAPRSRASREPRAAIDASQRSSRSGRWDSRGEGRRRGYQQPRGGDAGRGHGAGAGERGAGAGAGERGGAGGEGRLAAAGGAAGGVLGRIGGFFVGVFDALRSLVSSLVLRVRENPRFALIILGAIILLILLISLIRGCVAGNANEGGTPEVQNAQITVSFAGDCTLGTDEDFNPDTSFNKKYEEQGPAYFFANVKSIFDSDDLTIVNLEGPLTTSTDMKEGENYNFKGAPEYVNVLTQGGVEAASVANNHAHDYGDSGLQETITTLDNAGILNFGYERIAYTEVKGVKIAMVSGNMVDDPNDDLKMMIDNIGKAKEEGAQLIIAYPHWGIELDEAPGGTQMQGGRQLIDAGAHLVVGSHPHVIQGYEKYNGRYIVYSMANFCFGGNESPSDMDTWIFQQTFSVDADGNVAADDAINIVPCRVSSDENTNNYQPTPATEEQRSSIMDKISSRVDAVATLAKEFNQGENSGSSGSGSDSGSSDGSSSESGSGDSGSNSGSSDSQQAAA